MGLITSTKINIGCINTFRKKKILFAAWHVTYRCNLKCKFCSFWKNPGIPESELSVVDFENSIPSLLEMGVRVVNFAGGEPCIRKDLPVIVSKFSKDFIVIINTNGVNMTEKLAKELWEAGTDVVNVSLDFFYSKKHNFYRDSEYAYDGAIKAMKILNSTKVKKGQRVAMQAILSPDNMDEFEDMVKLAEELKVDFTFNPYRFGEHEIDLSFKNADLKFLYDLKKKYKCFMVTEYALDKTEEFVSKGYTGECCKGKYMLAIDPYGNVGPCENMMQHNAGNILKESAKDIAEKLLEIHYGNNCNHCLTRERSEVEPLYENIGSPKWVKEAMAVRKS